MSGEKYIGLDGLVRARTALVNTPAACCLTIITIHRNQDVLVCRPIPKQYMRRDRVAWVFADTCYKEREMIEHDATGKFTNQKFTRFYIRWNCILKTVLVRLRLKPQVGSGVDARFSECHLVTFHGKT